MRPELSEPINLVGMLADAASCATRTASDPAESDMPCWVSRLASIAFALDNRPETVPMGHPSRSAASRWDLPSNSHRTMGMRYLSGRRLNSRSSHSVWSSRWSSDTVSCSGMSVTWLSRIRLFALVDLAFKAVWHATP